MAIAAAEMAGSPALRASVRVIYEQKDITQDITPYVVGLTYTDSLAEADDLQLELADPQGLWSGPWLPDKNARLTVDIYVDDEAGRRNIPCGIFFIDTISESGPPSRVSIKATSVDFSTSLRREKKTRAWENVDLRTVFGDLASAGGLGLDYLADANPTYKRIEQKKQSDLELAKELAKRENVLIKVSHAKLVIFDADEYDSAAAVDRFGKHDRTRVISWNLETQVSEGGYKSGSVKYWDVRKKRLLSYLYQPADAPPVGAVLRINKRCESLAGAQRLARAEYESARRILEPGTVLLMGDTRLVAGVNIELDASWGAFAATYAIPEATHTLWPYTTSVKVRRIP